MANPTIYYVLLLVVVFCLLDGAWAFGAGDIPDFAFLNDKAFRHGDIENVITELVKAVASAGGFDLSEALSGGVSGGLLGFAGNVLKTAAKSATGGKFSKDDVKRIYFGNWLRDYSQAVDIAGLSKISGDNIVMIIAVLGFLEFGYATEEFRVTADRLGVYLPVEHIDNPKGYAEKEGDARQFHPNLRPPVDPQELEIDPRNGMKNYMATEDGGWDTSTAYIRRSFRASIEHARSAGGRDGEDQFEAYRTLGQGLHTLEDLLAHSNWCEIALHKLGYEQVFCHVGDNVRVRAPTGEEVPPLVTGTFGGTDFLHSLMGEGMDKLSQTSMTDVTAAMENSENSDKDGKLAAVKTILGKIMSMGGNQDSADEKMSRADVLKAKAEAYHFDPDNAFPPEVQQQLWDLLEWRDGVYRDVSGLLEHIPGLNELLDNLTDALNAYVYTLLAPYMTPILGQFSAVLGEGSAAVISSDEQYAVFDDPDASDPSHSLISKDHFALILNEPAGKIARVVVQHSVNIMTRAWAGEVDPDEAIDRILEAFHHPYWADGRSQVQRAMFDELEKWVGGLGHSDAQRAIENLTKEAVREHQNKRLSEDQEREANGSYKMGGHACGHAHGNTGGRPSGAYGTQQQAGYGRQQVYGTQAVRQEESGYGHQQGYGRQQDSAYSGGYDRAQDSSYQDSGREQSGYGSQYESRHGRQEDSGYGRQQGQQESSYGRQHETGSYGRQQSSAYGAGQYESREQAESDYARPQEFSGRGGYESSNAQASFVRQEEPSHGSRHHNSRGESRREEFGQDNTYRSGDDSNSAGAYGGNAGFEGRRRHHEESGGYRADERRSSREEYGGRDEQTAYGERAEERSYGRFEQSSYGRGEENEYGGRTERTNYAERSEDAYGAGYGGRSEQASYTREGAYNESSRGDNNEYRPGRSDQDSFSTGYGGGGYGSGETFGAERLNIQDDDNDGEHHHRSRHHGHRHHDD